MASMINIEKKLLMLDKELHSILDMLKVSKGKKTPEVVKSACGAWGYEIDSKKFVDQLRESKRLDWIT